MAAVDVVCAENLKPGDLYAGQVVPDAPTRPCQPFACAHEVTAVEIVSTAEGKRVKIMSGQFALSMARLTTQCMVIRTG